LKATKNGLSSSSGKGGDHPKKKKTAIILPPAQERGKGRTYFPVEKGKSKTDLFKEGLLRRDGKEKKRRFDLGAQKEREARGRRRKRSTQTREKGDRGISFLKRKKREKRSSYTPLGRGTGRPPAIIGKGGKREGKKIGKKKKGDRSGLFKAFRKKEKKGLRRTASKKRGGLDLTFGPRWKRFVKIRGGGKKKEFYRMFGGEGENRVTSKGRKLRKKGKSSPRSREKRGNEKKKLVEAGRRGEGG